MACNLRGRQTFDVSQDQGYAFALRKQPQAVFEIRVLFSAQYGLLWGFRGHFWRFFDFLERHAFALTDEVERRVHRDAAHPLRRLGVVLELIAAFQRFDKCVLSKVLGVGHIADDSIDQAEDPLHVRFDERCIGVGVSLAGELDVGFSPSHGLECRRLVRNAW